MEQLQAKKEEVLSRVKEMDIPENHMPFLPVVQRSHVGTGLIMSMMNANTRLDPFQIFDSIETPTDPYFVYDVEYGTDTLGKSADSAKTTIESQGREGLIVCEGVALWVHSRTLFKHNLNCVGSYYERADWVMHLFIQQDEPAMDYFKSSDWNDKWGSPSCHSRD